MNPKNLRDTLVMTRRDAIHALRNPMMTISNLITPLAMLLLFTGVFGGAMGGAVGSGPRSRSYVDYITPGILLMAVGSSVSGTAINVCLDKGEGIIARFRTMGIARTAVLTGQVIGSVIRIQLAVCIVLAVALVLGFRAPVRPLAWLEAAGLIVLMSIAVTWLGVAFGLFANSVAGANSLALIPAMIPFVSSAFVPTASMPAGVRWFAENQPYTPMTETFRALLLGTPIGSRGVVAVIWCLVIAAAGYLWARRLYNRDPSRRAGATVAQLMGS